MLHNFKHTWAVWANNRTVEIQRWREGNVPPQTIRVKLKDALELRDLLNDMFPTGTDEKDRF